MKTKNLLVITFLVLFFLDEYGKADDDGDDEHENRRNEQQH
jgi:hypothetical protein